MMAERKANNLLFLLLLCAVLVAAAQCLSATAPIDSSSSSASAFSGEQQQRRRQESLNAGRDALLSLNLNLDALARGEQADQAEALYTKITALHKEGYYEVRPDTVSFNSVLKAHRNDPVRALEFWEANHDMRKDIRSYNSFLASLANAGLAQDAYTLLSQMQMLNAAVRPDLISYNIVLLAYANAHEAEMAEALIQTMINAHHHRVHHLIDHLNQQRGGERRGEASAEEVEKVDEEEEQDNNARLHSVPSTTRDPNYQPPFPNEVSVSTVMVAWSRHDDVLVGAKKAEYWLYRHYDVLGRLPSPHAYAVTLQAYGRCDPDLAVQKVTEILAYMEQTDLAAPTYNTAYHIALSILANAQSVEAAKQVFQRMAQPDVQGYTRMIQMWGNYAKTLQYANINHRRDAAARANQCLMEILVLFRQMRKDPLALPNAITYTTTLSAIAETQLSNSGEIAIAVLRQMKNPMAEQYNAALKAVAHSNNPLKVVQASELFQEMIAQNIQPNRVPYNAILIAARSGFGTHERRIQNLHIAWDAFLALHELPDVPVTSVTYRRCLGMIDTQDRHRVYSLPMAKESLVKCCANGCMNSQVLSAARPLFANHEADLADLLGLPALSDCDDNIIAGLPKEWTEHAMV
jgi:Pentatricopeptide repeat domain